MGLSNLGQKLARIGRDTKNGVQKMSDSVTIKNRISAEKRSLERLFAAGHITFHEYVSAIDDDSVAPKACLENIIKNRGGQPDVNNQDIR